ncbi:hypothetical protein F4780DRAFT_414954 [Xylariomycetidae sp. FL0641]|nr:hypothetical protein F4780DRAFT_414954 [Xylariomycetidae sp. FL0641]
MVVMPAWSGALWTLFRLAFPFQHKRCQPQAPSPALPQEGNVSPASNVSPTSNITHGYCAFDHGSRASILCMVLLKSQASWMASQTARYPLHTSVQRLTSPSPWPCGHILIPCAHILRDSALTHPFSLARLARLATPALFFYCREPESALSL